MPATCEVMPRARGWGRRPKASREDPAEVEMGGAARYGDLIVARRAGNSLL